MKALLVGTGPTLYFLARDFLDQGDDCTLVTPSEEEAVSLAANLSATVLHGDGTDPLLLERAGARRADVVVAILPADHDNLATCQVAQRRFGVARTVSLVNDPDHLQVFRRLGVTATVSSTQVLADLLRGQAGLRDLACFAPVEDGRAAILNLTLQEGFAAVGRVLDEFPLPEGASVACILRGAEVIIPRGRERMRAGDQLLVLAVRERIEEAVRTLRSGS